MTVAILAAAIANLPAIHAMPWSRDALRIAITLATLSVLWPRRAATRPQSGVRSRRALLVLAILSVGCYYDFGRFHGAGHFVDLHEFYHYYMGSKYYPELGYDNLYGATYEALVENDPALARQPFLMVNLRTYLLEGTPTYSQRAANLAERFSDVRWRDFRRDVGYFQAIFPPPAWQNIFADHGYNATPFWTAIGASFTSHLSLGDGTLRFLASLDVLLLALILLLVSWAFGLDTCLVVAIFLFNNYFAPFDITGGAFLRQLWLAGLVAFVCLLRRGRPLFAGLALAVAVLDRVFPLAFGLAPLLLLLQSRGRRSFLTGEPARALLGLLSGLALFGCLSTALVGGPATWKASYLNIHVHEDWYSSNAISLRTLFVGNPADLFRAGASNADEAAWVSARQAQETTFHFSLLAVQAALMALLMSLVLIRGNRLRSTALIAFVPLLLLYPSDYYCTFLGIAVLFWEEERALALGTFGLQAMAWFLRIVLPGEIHVESIHWYVSLGFVILFGVALCRGLAGHAATDPRIRRRLVTLTAACAVLVCAGGAADAVAAARRGTSSLTLDLNADDVQGVHGGRVIAESMLRWGSAWEHNTHIVLLADGPGAEMTVPVPIKRAGRYRVQVEYSATPVFGIVQLRVPGAAPFDAVNLYSPRVGTRLVSYPPVPLRAGRIALTFAAVDKDPESAYFHIGIDRVILSREDTAAVSSAGPGEALEASLLWIREHPADEFDGGWNDMAAEALTLSSLRARIPAGTLHDLAQAAFDRDFRRLLALRQPRFRPEEYEMLIAAAAMCRGEGRTLAAFDSRADSLERWARGNGRDSSRLSESALAREHDEQSLSKLLNAGPDARWAPAVQSTFEVISKDVAAITNYGAAPAPRDPPLDDRSFWSGLFDHGLAWGMETHDVLTVARVLFSARALGVSREMRLFDPGIRFLADQQEPDGSFGAGRPDALNPRRETVLAAPLALAPGP